MHTLCETFPQWRSQGYVYGGGAQHIYEGTQHIYEGAQINCTKKVPVGEEGVD